MAKPLPASPARAASIVALSASRSIWPEMPLMISSTSPISSAIWLKRKTVSLVFSARSEARLAMCDDSSALPAILSMALERLSTASVAERTSALA